MKLGGSASHTAFLHFSLFCTVSCTGQLCSHILCLRLAGSPKIDGDLIDKITQIHVLQRCFHNSIVLDNIICLS